MQAGTIVLEWDAAGALNIKSVLPLNNDMNRKLAVQVMCDAIKAVTNMGSPLVMPNGVPLPQIRQG